MQLHGNAHLVELAHRNGLANVLHVMSGIRWKNLSLLHLLGNLQQVVGLPLEQPWPGPAGQR